MPEATPHLQNVSFCIQGDLNSSDNAPTYKNIANHNASMYNLCITLRNVIFDDVDALLRLVRRGCAAGSVELTLVDVFFSDSTTATGAPTQISVANENLTCVTWVEHNLTRDRRVAISNAKSILPLSGDPTPLLKLLDRYRLSLRGLRMLGIQECSKFPPSFSCPFENAGTLTYLCVTADVESTVNILEYFTDDRPLLCLQDTEDLELCVVDSNGRAITSKTELSPAYHLIYLAIFTARGSLRALRVSFALETDLCGCGLEELEQLVLLSSFSGMPFDWIESVLQTTDISRLHIHFSKNYSVGLPEADVQHQRAIQAWRVLNDVVAERGTTTTVTWDALLNKEDALHLKQLSHIIVVEDPRL
ncbi:hypothetical protein BDZ89DRAFT_1058367 [Hymenopellis radicata]|nr:hypothetical protein BDZ89DRAFT_1058367 [Hymenopellis radicata]